MGFFTVLDKRILGTIEKWMVSWSHCGCHCTQRIQWWSVVEFHQMGCKKRSLALERNEKKVVFHFKSLSHALNTKIARTKQAYYKTIKPNVSTYPSLHTVNLQGLEKTCPSNLNKKGKKGSFQRMRYSKNIFKLVGRAFIAVYFWHAHGGTPRRPCWKVLFLWGTQCTTSSFFLVTGLGTKGCHQ